MLFLVTVNQPGYLPECEPVEARTWDDACDALESALEDTYEASDASYPPHLLAQAKAIVGTMRRGGAEMARAVTFLGYAHDVAPL